MAIRFRVVKRPMARGAVVTAEALVLILALGCTGGGSDDGRPNDDAKVVPQESALDLLVKAAELGNPAAVTMPPVNSPAAFNWLDGPGRSAIRMVEIAELFWSDSGEVCPRVITELDLVGSPEDILAAAAGTPDQATRGLLMNLHTAIASTLRVCGKPKRWAVSIAELAWQWILCERRLQELGIAL